MMQQLKVTRVAAERGAVSMMWLLFIGLSGFVLWASLFEIEESVHATGQVIPSARTQIIQAADGGVLSEILVKEGESVKAGQRIAVLEKGRSNAAFEENRGRVASINAALIRANAEVSGRVPNFAAIPPQFHNFVVAQRDLFAQRKRSLDDEVRLLKENLSMAEQELQVSESLLSNGDAGRFEVIRARRQVNEIQARLFAVRNKYKQDAGQEIARLQEELTSSNYKLDEHEDVLRHTELKAPVAGVIKYLKLTTVGGVLRAGDEMMQISPTDGKMVIEVKINPGDIGHIRTGLPVNIKLDAFDYTINGTLKGTLDYISSDTLTDQGPSGQAITYYRAHVSLLPGALAANPKLAGIQLKPGMTASVDIRTNSRTVLRYIAKPIAKAFAGAMRER